ncbi:hypothetical protein D3C87_2010560 [compost metagenome]
MLYLVFGDEHRAHCAHRHDHDLALPAYNERTRRVVDLVHFQLIDSHQLAELDDVWL